MANGGAGQSSKPRRVVNSYRDLEVWQPGMDLAVECYQVGRCLPKDKLVALSSQLRRAAASVPANVAEGWGRQSRPEFVHFLYTAQGSLKETETHLLLAHRVALLSEAQIRPALDIGDQLGKAIFSLIRSLPLKPPTPEPHSP
jgi:four helix bundle protein